MFSINHKVISAKYPPYIIAELSANHNGSLEKAKKSILAAKNAGADAVKIQTYTPSTMTIDCRKEDFIVKDGLWKGYSLFELYGEAQTPFEWHSELFTYAKEINITIFSSPFDETAVDLLEDLNTPAYKIASFELCDLPLIKYIAKKGKPILMSTGMANIQEISEAVSTAKKNGCRDILLFHCISSYPAPIEQTNLKNILLLKEKFHLEVGLSDHTIGNTAAIASIAMGASAIEKHFILSRKDKGPDSTFSIEPDELRDLKKSTTETWMAIGNENFERSEKEKENKIFRRSLYFVKPIKKGGEISKSNVKRIRPGFGLAPKYESEIIGRKVKRDVEVGEPVKWEIIC